MPSGDRDSAARRRADGLRRRRAARELLAAARPFRQLHHQRLAPAVADNRRAGRSLPGCRAGNLANQLLVRCNRPALDVDDHVIRPQTGTLGRAS